MLNTYFVCQRERQLAKLLEVSNIHVRQSIWHNPNGFRYLVTVVKPENHRLAIYTDISEKNAMTTEIAIRSLATHYQ